ncbi:MAG: isoprenyl transferase, partial [Deltaproteobacteria bacterium]|nr:isoprenyl transferase [Deltaproteobacteria bacterium]
MKITDLSRENLPRHIAVIMDGNGRWAKNRSMPRIHGHQVGMDSVRAVISTCARVGV